MTSPPPGTPQNLQIAIDGPAGAGKSTVARRVAAALGLTYVDTGAMYRALAWAVLVHSIDPADTGSVCRLLERGFQVTLQTTADCTQVRVNGQDVTEAIRTPEISALTSPLSALPCVRARMVGWQKEMASGGVVMEGRDIGTVVMPQASVKVFLTASPARRARRRQEELAARGLSIPLDVLEREIAERDARDSGRAVSPLTIAPDAHVLDSDPLDIEEVVARVLELARMTQAAHV